MNWRKAASYQAITVTKLVKDRKKKVHIYIPEKYQSLKWEDLTFHGENLSVELLDKKALDLSLNRGLSESQ